MGGSGCRPLQGLRLPRQTSGGARGREDGRSSPGAPGPGSRVPLATKTVRLLPEAPCSPQFTVRSHSLNGQPHIIQKLSA